MNNLIKRLSEPNKSFCVVIDGGFGTVEITSNTSEIIVTEYEDCVGIVSTESPNQLVIHNNAKVTQNEYEISVEDSADDCNFVFIF